MKKDFCKYIALMQNYHSKLITRSKLFEKALGTDSTVIDFIGMEEVEFLTTELISKMFDKLDKKEIEEWLSWYNYDRPKDEPLIEVGKKKYLINNPEDLYDFLADINGG